ncbi:MAG: hypothetical protein J5905_03650 [Prevotella sp.]|jgi:hypothetical protein|nr:hypothetical protein [Prevotella sp.]
MVNSLQLLQERKAALKQEINAKEAGLRQLWDGVFHKPQPVMQSLSPTKRVLSLLSSSTAVIDGMLLGWKLYRRFGRKRR